MTKASKMEYYEEIKSRYKESEKDKKGIILDEFCKVCGYNRKYAIRKLSNKTQLKAQPIYNIGRPKIYYSQAIKSYILNVWKKTNLICSKRLIVPLREWLKFYVEENEVDKLTEEDKSLLRQISPLTVDRLLASHRSRYQKRGL